MVGLVQAGEQQDEWDEPDETGKVGSAVGCRSPQTLGHMKGCRQWVSLRRRMHPLEWAVRPQAAGEPSWQSRQLISNAQVGCPSFGGQRTLGSALRPLSAHYG